MNGFWERPITSEEKQALIERVTNRIKKKRLEAPAILFLEMHKPLANIGAHAMVAFSPFLVPFFGHDDLNNYSQFFAERENWELLIASLEGRNRALG